jgi:hypothetical protein
MEYYFSWSNSYDTNNYSWVDGFIGLVVCSSIGLLPFIVWLRFNRKKKKKQHTTMGFVQVGQTE